MAVIPRFSNLQVAFALSFITHFFLLFYLVPVSKGIFLPTTQIHDFHLPVSVELVRNAEVPQKNIEMPSALKNIEKELPQRESKSVFVETKLDIGAFRSNINPTIDQSTPKPHVSFNKNQLVSFAKAPDVSTKAWNRAPIYPESARRLGREGRVILDAQLNNAGKVVSVEVARSSGSADLDQAAIEAVREWTMDLPKDGTRRLFIPITFRFNSNS